MTMQCTSRKVAIRPGFPGTVPVFEGTSREKYGVARDAEMSLFSAPCPVFFVFDVHELFLHIFAASVIGNSHSASCEADHMKRWENENTSTASTGALIYALQLSKHYVRM